MKKQTEEKTARRPNKIMKIISWTVMSVLLVGIAGMLFVQFSPGYHFYYVKSGSMKPSINQGDIVVTGPVGGLFTGGLNIGKVITFKDNTAVVTHRINGILNGAIQTKGDANNGPDTKLVALSDINGIYLFKIPYIGYINGFVSNRAGWFIVIIIPTILLVLFLVKDIVKEAFKEEKKK